jgi:outer membrane beta-barrel protein
VAGLVKLTIAAAAAMSIGLAAPRQATAESVDEGLDDAEKTEPRDDIGGSRIAIQRPKYQMAHEISLSLGLMPLDAFQKGLIANLSYTVHIEEYVAWEVFHLTAAHLTSTDLRDELIDTFAIPPADFAAPRFMATTGVELSPVYGKQVFLNDIVVHQALFIGIHGGIIIGDRRDPVSGAFDFGDSLSDVRPAVGIGLGYRLFLTKTLSIRADARDFLSFKDAKRQNESTEIENVLSLTFGFSVNLWRDDA